MSKISETINRATLVNLLGVDLKTETPEKRETSIRVGVDKKLAKLFGAKLFLGYDWNLFSKPTYSLDQIATLLNDVGVSVSPESFIGEQLKVSKNSDSHYFFNKIIDSQGKELYRLDYNYDPSFIGDD